jgi:tetratricopeptide (TPR) repeat protein
LAQHFELAKERSKAISYWRLAGKQLAERGMLCEAIDSLTHALRLIPAEDPQKRFDLLFDREQLYDLTANRDSQTHDLAELQRLATVTGREDWRALVHLRRASLAETTAQYSIAMTEARAAATFAQSAGDAALHAAALRLTGRAAWWQGNLWRSRRYYTRALAAAEQAGAAPIILDCLIHLGIACWSLDDLEAARTCFHRVEREAEATSVQAIAAELGNGVIAAAAGRFDEADHKLTYSLELSVNLGWLWVEVQARLHLAGLLRRSQQFDRFFANHAVLLRQCEQVGDPWLMAAALYEAAAAHRSLGAWTQALALARTAIDRAGEIGAALVKVLALNTAAQTHLDLGDPFLAHQLTDQSLSLAARVKTPSLLIATLLIRSTALRRLHLFDEATDALLQARSTGWNDVSRRYLPDLRAAQAAITFEQGQLDVACALVERLLTDFDAAAIAGADSAVDIYLSCYRVLHAAHDPWATLPLTRAYHLIMARAATITNHQQRRSYQEKVPAHREIIALYGKAS